ncbi:response regulator transcription factor [Paenibacillus sp. FSL H7-0331]|uniref:response regulator transcription factor n=1 Tax=Paenibacillus sp. FSL H7-0331 TaxID=1920421 RepID=UPI00096F4F7C|nr:response regulator transcription factor [Paenibacillus sp. FSL H7-0331]OMF06064.1 DNA-binding response regulator [Paenibacillus sp. FSL H7-0331]
MKSTILIIDDDKQLCQLLQKCVSNENIDAVVYHSGKDGLEALSRTEVQLIVLDVMMPGMDGFDTLAKIREISPVPVLMLTSRTESSDKVRGLRAGADDYLTKPFDVDEFIARVQSLIRRYTTLNAFSSEGGQKLSFQGLTIELDTCILTVNGQKVDLPAKEFEVLRYLAENQGRVLTKQQIYERVWQEPYAYDDANIMGYISRLRKKIEPDANNPTYIQTVKGMGYRFNRGV